jgi:hypothetical protein
MIKIVRVFAGAIVFLTSATAFAQAWLPPKGTTTIGLGYGYTRVKKHLAPPKEVDVGHVTWNLATLQISHSVTDRLAVSASVPYVSTRYRGDDPHKLSDTDNGSAHGVWQDFRAEVDYQAMRTPIALTPFVALTIPTHDYTYFAHAAAGRDLRETTLGAYFGVTDLFAHFRSCGCPTATYLESRLAYSWVERVIGIRHDHINADLDAGYFATDKFVVRGVAGYNYTFGGIPFDVAWYGDYTNPRFLHHDQIVAERHLNLGAGVNYAVSDRLDISATAIRMVWGRNGHKIDMAMTTGIAWSFAPKNKR